MKQGLTLGQEPFFAKDSDRVRQQQCHVDDRPQ
jgi:hypothetical protein